MKKQKEKKAKNKKVDNKKIDLNNEIIIGLNRLDDDHVKNKKAKKKTKKQNVKKQKIKNNKKAKKNKEKKIRRIINNNESEQDIIFETKQEDKKKNRKKLKVLKYVFLGFCILAIIIAAMMSPLFNIKEINVEGNEKLTKEEIINLSEISINENSFRTSMIKAKNNIKQNPYIEDVKIKRVLPDKILISVDERKTTYMLEYGAGFVYINNQGYILEVSDQKVEVPILQGAETLAEQFVAGNRLCVNDLEKMTTVIKIMEIAQNNDLANLITRIDISNKQNYKIVFEGEQKVAYIGDNNDLNNKILSIKAIIEREKGIAGEIFVDMDLKNSYPTFRQSV